MSNQELMKWIKEMKDLCQPDEVVWLDGSDKQKKELEEKSIKTGEMIRLNEEKYPGCLYHRSAPNDVARTEHLTFICSKNKEDAGPTNNWMNPEEAYSKAYSILKNSMKERTMYVIPFSMGPVDSPFSKLGVQITDSLYVALSMMIMTRVSRKVIDKINAGVPFTKCMHGKADLDVNKRLILHFPQDNAIVSVGSGYGGNALLGKKCLALRIASAIARDEGWMAEHMLILEVESPDGRKDYVLGAFPSACGKTNLAMIKPPEYLAKKGYKFRTIGDDIAWLRIGEDGRLWAVNPENGFFGVAPGTNYKTNPNAMETVRKNTIFTNVLLTDDKSVWWEGMDGEPPKSGINWKGERWHPDMKDENGNYVYGAHPNSRYTAPIINCPSLSDKWNDPKGVPVSAILFGGRRASLAPLVYEAFNWEHGVYVGATMASERTAAQVGKLGELRRDPMAMLPFCGYNIGDYFKHWLEIGKKLKKPPKIFHVNWFRKDEDGKFLWPGYSENARVIEWIIKRVYNEVEAKELPIGYVPEKNTLDINGLDIDDTKLEKLLNINYREWLDEVNNSVNYLKSLGDRVPEILFDIAENVKGKLSEKVS